MLDVELIENLYNGLDKEQKERLMELVFKKSKQGITYFRRTNDITLSKLEIIADFFHMPLDYFRLGHSFKTQNFNGNNSQCGNANINTNLMAENQGLARELAAVKETLAKMEDMIKSKDEVIKAKDEVITMLKMQLHPSVIAPSQVATE